MKRAAAGAGGLSAGLLLAGAFVVALLLLVGVGGCGVIPDSHLKTTAQQNAAAASTTTTVAPLPAIANPAPPVIQQVAGGRVPADACIEAGGQHAPGLVYRAKRGVVTVPKGAIPRVAFVISAQGQATGRTLILPGRPATVPAAYAAIAVPAVIAPAAPLAEMKVVAKCAA